MTAAAEIHVAYAISRKNGTSYRARAYVMDKGVKHSQAIGIGDTANEAMGDAVRHIEKMHERDGLKAPTSIKFHGAMPGTLVDAMVF